LSFLLNRLHGGKLLAMAVIMIGVLLNRLHGGKPLLAAVDADD